MIHNGKYKEIVKKLIVEAEVEKDWETATKLYGEKTAKRLKKLAPTFPFLLYGISFILLMDEG